MKFNTKTIFRKGSYGQPKLTKLLQINEIRSSFPDAFGLHLALITTDNQRDGR